MLWLVRTREEFRMPSGGDWVYQMTLMKNKAVWGERWLRKMLFCILIQKPFVFMILKALGAADLNVGMLSTMTWNASDVANTPSSTVFYWRVTLDLPLLPILLSPLLPIPLPSLQRKSKHLMVERVLEKQWISDTFRSKIWFLILEYLIVINQDTISK